MAVVGSDDGVREPAPGARPSFELPCSGSSPGETRLISSDVDLEGQLPLGSAACEPGDLPGADMAAVATPPTHAPFTSRPASGGRNWASRLGWLRRSRYFRRGMQCGLGTALIVGVCAVPAVNDALALDSAPAASAVPSAFVLVNFYLLLLVSSASGMSPLQVGARQMVGALAGGVLSLGAQFAVYGLNGASYDDTLGKAAAMVVASALVVFCLTVARFHWRRYTLLWMFATLTYAISTATTYHVRATFFHFTFYWWAYSAIGGAVAYVCATFILPISAGTIVRRRLAAALHHTSEVARRTLDLASGEVDPGTGLLAAATGETSERIGLDAGLYPALQPLYDAVMAASLACGEAFTHLPFTPHWVDWYRRQRAFPRRSFWLMTVLARSMLNSVMMCVYPLQTGTLHVVLLARRRPQLLDLAAALDEACTAMGDVLVQNAPASLVLDKLRVLEARYAALAAAARSKGGALNQDAVALNLVLSLLFTAVTRLRRMVMLLPEALGADQPFASAPVLAHFEAEQAGEGGRGDWNFASLTQVPQQAGGEGDPLEMLRASLVAAQPRRSPSGQALALLEPPGVLALQRGGAALPAWRRTLLWLPGLLGVKPQCFSLAVQLVVAYTLVLILVTIPDVNAAFQESLTWTLFVLVSVMEPSTGGAIFKGLQRLVGAVAAGCLGVAVQYWVYLLNGLSYAEGAGKTAAMAASLAVLAGGAAAGGVRFPRYSYAFTIGAVTMGLTALPGFDGDQPQPQVALWRAVNTVLGVALEVAAVSLILPVTARRAFRNLMAATLRQLAAVSCTAFEGALPRPLRKPSLARSSLQPAEQQQSWWWQRWGPLAPPSALPLQSGAEEEESGAAGLGTKLLHPWRKLRQHQDEQLLPAEVQVQLSGRSPGGSSHGPHAAVEVAGKGGQDGARPTLRPVLVRVSERQPLDAEPGLVAASPHCPRSPELAQLPSSPMSQAGSAAGGSFRRRGARRSAGAAGTPRSPGSRHAGLERGGSLSSDVSAHLSVYVSHGQLKVISTSYAQQLPGLMSIADQIVALVQLRTPLAYEWYPFSATRRFPFDAGFRAQRLCRHLLNVVTSVPILLDSHEVAALPLLAPYAPRLHPAVEQLAACLEGLALVVERQQPPSSVVSLVLSLEEHVRRLFLAVLTDLGSACGSADRPSDSDVITLLAFVSVVVNAAYVTRLLAIALIRAICPPGAANDSEAALLDRPNRWSVDDRMMQLFTGILGVAIGSSAMGSGGPITPHAATPRLHRSWEAQRAGSDRSSLAASTQQQQQAPC